MIDHEWESGPWTGISVPIVERDGTTEGLRVFLLLRAGQVVRATLDVPVSEADWQDWASGTGDSLAFEQIIVRAPNQR